MAVSANRLELLQIADAVAREKSIDREIVIAAMADAIQKAARSRYGQETNIRVDINTKTGEMKLQRLLEVVEEVEDPNTQIYLDLARDKNPDAEPGDFIAGRARPDHPTPPRSCAAPRTRCTRGGATATMVPPKYVGRDVKG